MIILVVIIVIISIVSTIYVVRYFDNQTRDRVPQLRKDLCKTFTEYGMENEVKDELLYVLRNGVRLRLRFYNSYGGIITLFIESLINLEEFNIDNICPGIVLFDIYKETKEEYVEKLSKAFDLSIKTILLLLKKL